MDEKDLTKTPAAAFTPEELDRLAEDSGAMLERALEGSEGLLERALEDADGLLERALEGADEALERALAPAPEPAPMPARRPLSLAKRKANRRNALKSTGPKTPAGKAKASGNACKHGLLSRAGVLTPGEDLEDFRDFETALRTDLAPKGELEALLADRIVTSAWRLRRVVRLEAGVFSSGIYDGLKRKAEREAEKALGFWRSPPSSSVEVDLEEVRDRIEELEEAEADKKADADAKQTRKLLEGMAERCESALEVKREAENALHEEPTLQGRAYIGDAANADAFSKLSRYETSLERSLFRALHELQRLQAARQHGRVLAPVAVDLEVSGAGGEGF